MMYVYGMGGGVCGGCGDAKTKGKGKSEEGKKTRKEESAHDYNTLHIITY